MSVGNFWILSRAIEVKGNWSVLCLNLLWNSWLPCLLSEYGAYHPGLTLSRLQMEGENMREKNESFFFPEVKEKELE